MPCGYINVIGLNPKDNKFKLWQPTYFDVIGKK